MVLQSGKSQINICMHHSYYSVIHYFQVHTTAVLFVSLFMILDTLYITNSGAP